MWVGAGGGAADAAIANTRMQVSFASRCLWYRPLQLLFRPCVKHHKKWPFCNKKLLTRAATRATAASGTLAAPPEPIEESIVHGLAWLAAQQLPDGSWVSGDSCNDIASTALAVLKFESRAFELGLDPLDPTYEYALQVAGGLAFIMTFRLEQPIGLQPAGDPDSNGNGIGVYFDRCGYHQIYNTAAAMMALAASQHPELYAATLQDAVDFMAWAQTDEGCGPSRGGWRYFSNACDSDNSNSGYVTLGLGYAAALPPCGFGLAIPDWVKAELSPWLDVMQDDVNGDPDDGGSWYDPSWAWVNILKTGNLLYEFALVGDPVGAPRVQDAIDYIERHWSDPGSGGTGWLDHRQAMFAMMKGLEAYGIDLLDLDGDGTPETDWFDAMSTHLLATQNADGSWPWDPWADPILSTTWGLLALERAVCVPPIHVAVDIKPGSCPNPLQIKNKGVLPVAVLGTADFDVTTIDPASIRLTLEGVPGGVAPLRWSYEDVGTPFAGELCGCHDLNGDGYLDLALKFDVQAVVTTLGLATVVDTTLPLLVTGNLKAEAGGTPIKGADCVRVQ